MTPCPASEIEESVFYAALARARIQWLDNYFWRLTKQRERDEREIARWRDRADLVRSLRS